MDDLCCDRLWCGGNALWTIWVKSCGTLRGLACMHMYVYFCIVAVMLHRSILLLWLSAKPSTALLQFVRTQFHTVDILLRKFLKDHLYFWSLFESLLRLCTYFTSKAQKNRFCRLWIEGSMTCNGSLCWTFRGPDIHFGLHTAACFSTTYVVDTDPLTETMKENHSLPPEVAGIWQVKGYRHRRYIYQFSTTEGTQKHERI